MDGFLRVNSSTSGTLPQSPTNLFLADEVASTCPLITPSPPTNDLINPLPEPPEPPAFIIGEALANKLQSVKGTDEDRKTIDSGTSSASHRQHYHTKSEASSAQETNGKVQPMQLTFRNPPDDFCFMSWNWPLIRKLTACAFAALLAAMTALVISMISSLPTTCNPPAQWYQGSVFYEIFPASFHDTDKDGVGDLTGITYYANYLQDMGIGAVRLNAIFPSRDFPEDCDNVSTLLEIEPKLGTLNNFKILADGLHLRNISLILDLPLYPLVKTLNDQHIGANNESNVDAVTEAILYWLQYDVDGFYLKGLEHYVTDPNFRSALRRWKRLLRADRVLIVSQEVLKLTPNTMQDTLLANVDLIDIKFKVESGVSAIRSQVEGIQNSSLFAKAGMPWIHWSIGDLRTERLADRLAFGNATMGATLLQLMLPGTPSIFYGDEIGMRQIVDQFDDAPETKHLQQLGTMIWPTSYGGRSFTDRGIMPWIKGRQGHSSLRQPEVIGRMVRLRRASPSIYLNSVQRDGHNKANCEVKYSQGNLLVIQRYYPRRKAFVVVSNLGQTPEKADLSELLYSGKVLVGPQPDSSSESISFKDISLWPGESVVIVLD